MQLVRKSMFKVCDVLDVQQELNELERGYRAEGYEVVRGFLGSVVLKFPDGEVHYVPSGNGIDEYIFSYEKME